MTTDNNNKVQLSPKTMVDSVAEWPLYKVVEHLKRKEKDETTDAPARVHCRSSIRLLADVLDDAATDFGLSRSLFCRYLSFHSIAIAREDKVVRHLAETQNRIRKACLRNYDTYAAAIMNSLVPYFPEFVDECDFHIPVYAEWVSSEFDAMARVCGVKKYRIVQIFMLKSLLGDDALDKYPETATELSKEMERWDAWMGFRLAGLESLLERKTGGKE